MKSILLATALMLSATASLAFDDHFVQVLTWCEGNKVMSDKEDGTQYVYKNCDEYGQVCRTFQIDKRSSTIFAAACQAE